MKKPNSRRRMTVLLICAGALGLLGMVMTQAQEKGGKAKPVPPASVWGIELPDLSNPAADSLNLYGMEDTTGSGSYTYWNNEADITVLVQKLSRSYPYEIYLFVDNPTSQWVHFKGLQVVPDPNCPLDCGNVCGFPSPYADDGCPDCVQAFLNGADQPAQGYDHFMITLKIFADIYSLPLGTEIRLQNGDWGEFFLWNMDSCDDPLQGLNPYHTVVGTFSTSDDDADGGGFFMTRTGDAAWTIRLEQQKFMIKVEYCAKELVTLKNGKSYYGTKSFLPFTGWSNPLSMILGVRAKND